MMNMGEPMTGKGKRFNGAGRRDESRDEVRDMATHS
jgi:hypothetical protein